MLQLGTNFRAAAVSSATAASHWASRVKRRITGRKAGELLQCPTSAAHSLWPHHLPMQWTGAADTRWRMRCLLTAWLRWCEGRAGVGHHAGCKQAVWAIRLYQLRGGPALRARAAAFGAHAKPHASSTMCMLCMGANRSWQAGCAAGAVSASKRSQQLSWGCQG